jgi:hypothetical protein
MLTYKKDVSAEVGGWDIKIWTFFGLIVLNFIDSYLIINHSMLLKNINQHVWYVPNQGLIQFNALLVFCLGLFRQNHMYLYWITKGDINYGSLSCHAIVDYRINMQIYLRIEILQMLTFASSPFYIYI